MPFAKGRKRHPEAGVKLGSKQRAPSIRRCVYDLIVETNKHPVEHILEILPELSPKERCHVWLTLLSFIAPRMSAQAIVMDDHRDHEDVPTGEAGDVTTDDLLTKARGGNGE